MYTFFSITPETFNNGFSNNSIEVDVIDINSYDKLKPSNLFSRGDMNWNSFDSNIGFRLNSNGCEYGAWMSNVVYPNNIPHILKRNRYGISTVFFEDNYSGIDMQRLMSFIVAYSFNELKISKLLIWITDKTHDVIVRSIINTGWVVDKWYTHCDL